MCKLLCSPPLLYLHLTHNLDTISTFHRCRVCHFSSPRVNLIQLYLCYSCNSKQLARGVLHCRVKTHWFLKFFFGTLSWAFPSWLQETGCDEEGQLWLWSLILAYSRLCIDNSLTNVHFLSCTDNPPFGNMNRRIIIFLFSRKMFTDVKIECRFLAVKAISIDRMQVGKQIFLVGV